LKYFICAPGSAPGSALGKINIGIPAEYTERIIQVTRKQDAVCETENQEVYISLPALLRQQDRAAPHGIVLKPGAGTTPAGTATAKTTLLTPRIDAELEIPEDCIRGLPKAMDGGVYGHFRGAYCTGQNVILVFNPKKLLEGKI